MCAQERGGFPSWDILGATSVSRVCLLRLERAKSARQVHPTFAERFRAPTCSYVQLLRGISTSCEL